MGIIRRFLLASLLAVSGLTPLAEAAEYWQAKQGEVDLENWKGASTLALAGEWFFFPQELLKPEDFLQRWSDPAFTPHFSTIGQSFNEASGGRASDVGYGTYVVRLKHWPTREPLGFAGVQVYTAADIYFFGRDGQGTAKPIQTIGRVADKEEEGGPQIRVDEIQPVIAVEEQDYFFLIQVSNFHHAWGGLWRAPHVASIKVLNATDKLRERISFFVVGCIFFAAAYNFSLFTRRPEDKGSLILAFIAFELGFNSATSTFFPAVLFGSYYAAYAVGLKTLYMTMMLSPMLAIMFLRCYFPAQMPKKLHNIMVGVLGLTSILFAILPVRIFSVFGTAGQIFGLMAGALCSICVVRAWRAKERGANLIAWGYVAVLTGATMEVLMTRGWFILPVNCMNLGLMVLIMMQSQIVGVHFAQAFRQAEHLSRELKTEVDRQTRDIKSILNSIQQGIFTLVGTGWTIGDQYSNHLKKIVKQEQVAGSSLKDLLLNASDLSSDSKSQTMSALNAAMGEDVLVFETNAHCLADEMSFTPDNSDEARILEVEWTPMVDAQNIVDKVLVCVRDVTELRDLKRQAQQQEEELRILQEILRIPEDRFQRFILKTDEYLRQNRQLILNVGSYERAEVVRHLFMNMHTIKGTARTYFLYAISSASHDVEQFYAALQKGEVEWDKERLLADLDRVSDLVRHYDQVGREKLGWSSTDKILRLPRKRLLDGLDRLTVLHAEPLSGIAWGVLAEVESILMESCYSPIQSILEDACKGIDSLARDLQKVAPQIQIALSAVIMRDDGADLLHSILIHLLRNSLDHGLESAAERQLVGKDPQGTIAIGIVEDGAHLLLHFSDDGRGLDLEKIAEIGRARGLLPAGQAHSDAAIADLIFHTGFSTKDEVTEVSGRGVGMDAVRNYLKNVGGTIQVEFLKKTPKSQGQPFRYEILLPGEIWWSPARRQVS